ncbi:hypothetical protein BGX34_004631, partial [Mortierella sp. NVP85]
ISVVSAAPKSKVMAAFKTGSFFYPNFCLLLPPYPRYSSRRVNAKPELAVSYCNFDFYDQTVDDYDDFARFIKSVHYYEAPQREFVQVTGHFNRKAFRLREDRGGQYDYKNVPGAKCENYPYFVQILESNTEIFCLRCCQRKRDCQTNQFRKGCANVIPGDYSVYYPSQVDV